MQKRKAGGIAMAISKIEVKNFTVFDEIAIDFTKGINIFIGENGTGKTHLLKLLYSAYLVRCDNCDMGGIFGEDFDSAFMITHRITDVSLISEGTEREIANTVFGKGTIKKGPIKWEQLEETRKIREPELEYFRIGSITLENSTSESPVIVESNRPFSAIFISTKDMLTHGRLEKDYAERNLPFDTTLIDILNKAGVSTVKNMDKGMAAIQDKIVDIIGGEVVYKSDRYYIQMQNGPLIGFDMVAEGHKKLGLIYRLIDTGYLTEGSVLIWDEPEANLNPKLIPFLVDILLALEQAGVQLFIATHDYFFTKYIDVRKTDKHRVRYHALYFEDSSVQCEQADRFESLRNNVIIDQSINLYKEEVEKVMG